VAGDLSPATPATGDVWSAQGAHPDEVEAALREMLRQRHAESEAFVPARVLNLVVVADREWRGEIQNRLEHVGRYHASRTILCLVEPGRRAIDAVVTMTSDVEPRPGELAVLQEQVILLLGERHLGHLETIVGPLVVPDLSTLVWSPHGHPEAVDALLDLAQIVLIDSVNEPDPTLAVRRARELSEKAYVVDLGWLRSTPWRERVAATFDPPPFRPELGRINGVWVRHRPDSAAAALLFVSWLCERLRWDPGAVVAASGMLHGTAQSRKEQVKLHLHPEPSMNAPGLAGITISTTSGMEVSLDRGPGGLTARRKDRKGREWAWTVLGASRGEAGILGEGIRQALLRDKIYSPALRVAERMIA
jgi:glucose-6-phosphate dehydrogenase assembly protein OpcA